MAQDNNGTTMHFSEVSPIDYPRRISALKKLQIESTKLESQFCMEVYKLECKYHELCKELYAKREQILSGKVNPTDEECQLPQHLTDLGLQPEQEDFIKNFKEKFHVTDDKGYSVDGTPGIPGFWLTIFRNVELLNDMIQPCDENILRYLTDIQVETMKDSMGYTLKFIFASNPYFANTCLTKEYGMKCNPDEEDPFSFEGPEIYTCKGCTIRWRNQAMNVTLKTVKKRQRHKSKGAVRTIVKSVQNDSFFNFFTPPVVSESSIMDEETQALLTSDFEIGHYIKEKIVPRAVLYYTGEALEDEELRSHDSSDSDEEDSDNDENDGDEEDFEESEASSGDDVEVVKNEKKTSKTAINTQDCAQQ